MQPRRLPTVHSGASHALLAVALAGLVVITGCDLINPEAPPFALRIETDRDRYHVARDSVIQVEIHNTSGDTLYYNSCIGTIVEVLDDGRVVDRIGLPTCFCSCLRTLAPGERMPPGVSNVSIRALTRYADRLPADEPVSLRLGYGQIFRDEAWDDLLTRPERHSNPFELQGLRDANR